MVAQVGSSASSQPGRDRWGWNMESPRADAGRGDLHLGGGAGGLDQGGGRGGGGVGGCCVGQTRRDEVTLRADVMRGRSVRRESSALLKMANPHQR